jgi:hypothetical protein
MKIFVLKRNVLLDGRLNHELQNVITKRPRKWGPETIFNGLVAILLLLFILLMCSNF